jgi:hypothetical protein
MSDSIALLTVTPAKAGVQNTGTALALDSRFRGNDDGKENVTSIRKGRPMRKLLPLLLLCIAGCTQSETFKSTIDGSTGTCTGAYFFDINVWSNYPLCLEEYTSAGYQRVR